MLLVSIWPALCAGSSVTDHLGRLNDHFGDRYRIERELGRGGMATVYLAHDLRHDRQVAIKVLRPELAAALGPSGSCARSSITASLQHPHILPLLDSGDAGRTASCYYVMPFVEGESLRDRLARERQLPVGGRAPDRAGGGRRARLRPRARASSTATSSRRTSCCSDGHAVVADFGIARAVHGSRGRRALTETGTRRRDAGRT